MNTFHEIAETSPPAAIALAHAFCSCNGDFDSLFACLRLLDRLHGRSGGHFSGYLDGRHFAPHVFEDRDYIGLRQYRAQAYAFLESIDSHANDYPKVDR